MNASQLPISEIPHQGPKLNSDGQRFGTRKAPREVSMRLGRDGSVTGTTSEGSRAPDEKPAFGTRQEPREVSGTASGQRHQRDVREVDMSGTRSVKRSGTSEGSNRGSGSEVVRSVRSANTSDKLETPAGTVRHLRPELRLLVPNAGEAIVLVSKGTLHALEVFLRGGTILRQNHAASLRRSCTDALARPAGDAPSWGDAELPVLVKRPDVATIAACANRRRPATADIPRILSAVRGAYGRDGAGEALNMGGLSAAPSGDGPRGAESVGAMIIDVAAEPPVESPTSPDADDALDDALYRDMEAKASARDAELNARETSLINAQSRHPVVRTDEATLLEAEVRAIDLQEKSDGVCASYVALRTEERRTHPCAHLRRWPPLNGDPALGSRVDDYLQRHPDVAAEWEAMAAREHALRIAQSVQAPIIQEDGGDAPAKDPAEALDAPAEQTRPAE